METRKDAQGEEDGNELGKFGQYHMRQIWTDIREININFLNWPMAVH